MDLYLLAISVLIGMVVGCVVAVVLALIQTRADDEPMPERWRRENERDRGKQ